MPILSRLRAATSDAHQALEHELDLIERLSSRQGRRTMVGRFFGLHDGAERSLAPRLSGIDGLEFSKRLRTPHLARDLGALEVDTGALTPCAVSPAGSAAEALGFFYVLEGSTLGGKVVRRAMENTGGDMTGLSFLNPYAERTGERWRAFTGLLEREAANDEAAGQMLTGAARGFAQARSWLCAPLAVSE